MYCIVGCLVAVQGWAQPQYEVVDLTKMFGEEFTAVDINNNGVVVGHMRLNASQDQACIIQNGKLIMLPKYQGKHSWYAIGINDNGDVLGAAPLASTGTYHSILYRNGKVIDIGVPGHQGFPGSFAINNFTQATGFIGTTPFIWENGVTTPVAGEGVALAINDTETLVGRVTVGVEHEARMWRQGVYSSLHPAWARRSEAVSTNEADEAVGSAWALAGGQHAVLWRDGKDIQLGNFGGGQSRAYDINEQSQVVGWANSAGQPDEAFLWEQGTLYRVEDLIVGGSGFELLGRSIAINNAAQQLTIGFGPSSNGWLLLNPVPEPSSIVILGGFAALLGFIRLRNHYLNNT
jgi:probable HAF family extracellular repeat protein